MSYTVFNGRSANEHADDAAEAIRGINHLTFDAGSLRYPSDVYRILGSLDSVVSRLPQALEQIDRLLQRWLEAEEISIDQGEFVGDPPAAVAAATTHLLNEARPALAQAGKALAAARDALTWASYTGDVDDDDPGRVAETG